MKTCLGIIIFILMSAATAVGNPYYYDLDERLLTKTTTKIEKMLPVLEKQVELLIKMISNEKYRSKLENEFGKVLVGYSETFSYGITDPKECVEREGCQGMSLKPNEMDWQRGKNLSFLAEVLKEYKAPLSKTCIGVIWGRNTQYQSVFQPLNWNFPIAFLSGHMFIKKANNYPALGFGQVDLLSLDKKELIRMARISNKIIELQKVLRDGIEDKFDADALQKFSSFERSAELYVSGYTTPFGTGWGKKPYDENPCDIYAGKGQAKFFWPVIGYELILPKEIVVNARGFWWRSNDYTFGGGALETDLARFPSEYIDAWKNLAIYLDDYFPGFNAELPIDMYEKLLREKVDEEPLGDLFSDGDNGEISTTEDDDLALPSLD